MTEIDKNFEPHELERKWYDKWLETNSFTPKPGHKTFTLIMPPPNVTGRLHMGHALDATTQDVLTRFKRMQGFETLWIPGTDHAGIATQSVVEKMIYKNEKKTKHDLGKEEFLKRIWAWKEQYGEEIINQQKKIGVSCDWNYSTFTMDEIPNLAVRTFFVQLYNEGLIYQADYIVNWDTVLQSAISDAEVEHKEVKGFFYHLMYQISGSEELVEIATTRPETIFADVALAVHPEDNRYRHLIGKKAIIPLTNREIPIIADEYVTQDKGTGCLKVTPGHDFNDFEIGKRHNLPILIILNSDGRFNAHAPLLEGLKVKEARLKIEELLNEKNLLKLKKEHIHQVAHAERSGEIVEPLVSKQWFLKTQAMSHKALEAVENAEMKFIPQGWENTYYSWLRNPKDWCLSRQLWWGHKIPVYYCAECGHQWASVDQPHDCPECRSNHFKQDPDVLDTWFSSGLWPLSTLGWPDKKVMAQKGFDRFYPNHTLITGFDIIFFWVARMMMMGLKITNQVPFKDVYIHAIVRDKQGRKMSKSLNNGIDPIEMIDKYGADAVRFTLAANSGYNRDINLDADRIEGYRNFMNKIWNAYRFISPHLTLALKTLPSKDEWHVHDQWIIGELNQLTKDVTLSLEKYRYDEASLALYHFIYEKFCSWYIELSKPIFNSNDEKEKIQRASVLKYCFEKILILLHPIAPFISEEIWSHLKSSSKLLINESYPIYDSILESEDVQSLMNKFIELTSAIRNLRSSVNLKPKDEIDVKIFTNDESFAKFVYQSKTFLKDLAQVKSGQIKSKGDVRPKKSATIATSFCEIYLPLEGLIDINVQIERLSKDLSKTKNDQDKLNAKLLNENFVKNAPPEVIDEVHIKQKTLAEKIDSLEKILASFQD